MEEPTIIGQPFPQLDAVSLADGTAEFCSDIRLPGMLYGKILRSPLAHARVMNIDTSRAERLPGVKAVITGQDTSGVAYSYWVELLDTTLLDKHPLAMEKVRYVGDELAAVAAIDEEVAKEALELITVDYQELPAVFDPEEAMDAGAPLLHAKERNISVEMHLNHGEVEKELARADYIREERFVSPAVGHCQLEGHNCLVSWEGDKITIWSATQSPISIRTHLSRMLGISPSKVRVITPHVGGGFGGRAEMLGFEYCTALLSLKTGRPVKTNLDREEVFSATRVRHPQVVYLKTGVKKDGTILAQEARLISNNGAYNGWGPVGLFLSTTFLTAPFRIPNFKCDSYLVYTNTPIGGPMRGFGAPQVRFAADSHLDGIARELGLDIAEIMLKNAIQPGDEHDHFNVTSFGVSEAIAKATQMANWKARRGNLGPARGLGIGCHIHESGAHRNPYMGFTAEVRVHEDGRVTLLTGAVDVGQGARTALAQIVAEEFGVRLEDVVVARQDTEVTPLDHGTFSSRVTFWTGNAVKAAAADAKRKLLEAAAQKLEANPQDLVARDRRVFVKGTPEKGLPMDEAVSCYNLLSKGDTLVGHGFFSLPVNKINLSTGEGRHSSPLSSGATVAEVEVDTETGMVKVIRLITAHDCGRALNPLAVEGQLNGAVLMGKGYALSEHLCWEGGSTMNASFTDYRLPSAADTPELSPIIVESPDPLGPFGAKECGEGPLISVAPALANAVNNALGVRIKELPLTPEKVLKALEKARG